jgi:nitrite reductase/ring-hydroxylating ferredoxin subunit
MLLGAYLGGHLVFSEQIGVNHAVEMSLPTDFKRLMPLTALSENKPQNAELNGVQLVLVRRGARIYALLARCTHRGGPLAEGTLEDETIRCPWHGSRFSLEDGNVIEGPATVPQPCFETRVVDGWIEVRAARAEAP